MKRELLTRHGYLPSPSEPEPILELIKRHGIYVLGGYDGCPCTSFSIGAYEVDVSCHKSKKCVRVVCSYSGQRNRAGLEAIANAVLAELAEEGRSGYQVRFCDISQDHANGRWECGKWVDEQKCCYCASPRADVDGYLCEDCRLKPIAESYSFDRAPFVAREEIGSESGA